MWRRDSERRRGNSTNSWYPRCYREGDDVEIARLAATVYPSIDADKFLRHWRSKYMGCPQGFVSWIAAGAGKVTGHYGSLITSATLAGRQILVAQAVDAFTHPDWRKRGIFVGLGKALLDDLGSKGVHLTYGIPNKAAMPGHEKLSWKIVAEIPRMVAILDRDRAFATYQGGWLKKTALRISSAFHRHPDTSGRELGVSITRPPWISHVMEHLWASVSGEFGFALNRNDEYLSWRYPAQSDRNYVLIVRETNGAPAAAAVCGIGTNGMGQIAELLFRGGHEGEADMVLRGAMSHFKKKGCHTVEALASIRETQRVLKSAGFFRVSRIPMIAHGNDAKGMDELKALLESERIMLSFGDSDLA